MDYNLLMDIYVFCLRFFGQKPIKPANFTQSVVITVNILSTPSHSIRADLCHCFAIFSIISERLLSCG